MQITTQLTGTAHQALVDLVVSGPLRAVTALPGGGWEVTPVTGRPLILTDEDQAHAYLARAASTGAPALAPARAIGVDAFKGSLEAGKDADVWLADEGMNARAVFLRGRRIR